VRITTVARGKRARRGGADLRSMSVVFRMCLSHLDNGLSCGGSARASVQHGRSVQDVSFGFGRVGGMPVQSDRRAGDVAGQRLCAHEHGRHGRLLLPGAVGLFARAQIGMVSQTELVLWLGRAMAIRFREAMGVLSSGMSIALTLSSLGSVANSTLVDAHNTIESSFLDVMRSQCHGLTSLHTDHHARGAGCWTQGVIGYAAAQHRSLS